MTIENIINKYIKDIPSVNTNFDEDLFDRILNFIIDLEPDQLSDEQLEEVISILDDLNIDDEVSELRLSKRSSIEKKRKSKQFYRKNKQKILMKRKRLRKSSEGRKIKRLRNRMEKSGKTATGRKKITYHV